MSTITIDGRILFAGDWHGNLRAVEFCIDKAKKAGCVAIVQLGDFGYGWDIVEDGCRFTKKVSLAAQAAGIPIYWIDGNHENFDHLEMSANIHGGNPVELEPGVRYLPRGTVLVLNGMKALAVGGGYSIDKAYRVPGVTWWPQEETTFVDVEIARNIGPVDVVLAHDVCKTGFEIMRTLSAGLNVSMPAPARNRALLEFVLDSGRPSFWFHGHYHMSYHAPYGGTIFRGLNKERDEGSTLVFG